MVSCLLVTLPSPARLDFLRRSVAAYCAQTHPAKELVVVVDAGTPAARAAIAAHLAALGRADIRMVEAPAGRSLGALRNLALDRALGEFVCQWDDDDLHHPRRVELQLAALAASGKAAVLLEEAMHFFAATRTLYCTNWRATPATGLPPSLLCARGAPLRYPEAGPDAQRGEDLAVVLQLKRANALATLGGVPHLYGYVCHGGNTWPNDHHRMLAAELAISRGLLVRREAQLRAGLQALDFGPGEVSVEGRNGPAFTLAAAPPLAPR